MTITVTAPASISIQPQPTAACSGSPAAFSVTATGNSPVYAWRQRGTGWGSGNGWVFNNASDGGFYVGDSSLNGNGSSGNINTSGKSWGIYNNNATQATEAVRTFPSALTVGNQFQIDMDNGYINSAHSAGLSLRNASGNVVWELYFHGGDWTYNINDNAGPSTNSAIPYTDGGLRIIFTLTSTTTYSVTVQRNVGGTTYGPFTGTLKNPTGGSVPAQVRLWSDNGASGGAYDLFFNNLVVNGNADDNAAAYSTTSGNTGWQVSAGNANGGQAPLSDGGDISGSATSTLNISPAESSDAGNYDVIVYNSCGTNTSSATALTVNTTPALSNVSSNRQANVSLKIPIASLVASASAGSDTLVLSAVSSSTNGVAVYTNNVNVFYNNPNNVNDHFGYTITDVTSGCSTNGTVFIQLIAGQTGQTNAVMSVAGNGVTTVTFFGVQGLPYVVLRSTNLDTGVGWVPISTNTAPAQGLFQIIDNFSDLNGGTPVPPSTPPPAAFYELSPGTNAP